MKNTDIRLRISEREKESIKERSAAMQMSMSEYILHCIREKEKEIMNKYAFYETVDNEKCDYGIFELKEIKEMVEEYRKDDEVDEEDSPARKNVRYFAKHIQTGETIEL